MEELRAKSLLLTAYLELLLKHYYPKPASQNSKNTNGVAGNHDAPYVEIITPADPAQRGCQLSAVFSVPVTEVFQALQRRGVVVRRIDASDIYICDSKIIIFVSCIIYQQAE